MCFDLVSSIGNRAEPIDTIASPERLAVLVQVLDGRLGFPSDIRSDRDNRIDGPLLPRRSKMVDFLQPRQPLAHCVDVIPHEIQSNAVALTRETPASYECRVAASRAKARC